MTENNEQSGVKTVERQKTKVRRPKMYRVVMLNDDFTTMDFVVMILESVFKKGPAEAMQIMLSVHKQGRGMCGVYTREIAEAKVELVHARAKSDGYPLRCIIEEA